MTASRSPGGLGGASAQRRPERGDATRKDRISIGFIAWIVVGAIAGFLANQIMGSPEGLLMMVVLGVVGGLVGGFVATSVLRVGSVDGINIESIVIATLGAITVVFVVGLLNGSRGLGRR